MVEESLPPEMVEIDTLTSWYEEASQLMLNKAGLSFPPFPSYLKESELIFNKKLNIEHAYGQVFYPCSGSDSELITDLFYEYSTDINLVNTSFGDIQIDHLGNINNKAGLKKPIIHDRYLKYEKDGLITLLEDIENLSVFFYRGDSFGESGSNQRWLEETLFIVILSKLINHGLIVTDGSNCGYVDEIFDEYAPWNPLCVNTLGASPEIGQGFEWSNFSFRCVAGPFEGNNCSARSYAWQVENKLI